MQAVAEDLQRWSPGGASAERMFRTLTDPDYKKATNKHGRRLNSRKGTPMHVMAAYALRRMANFEGNLNQMSAIIVVGPQAGMICARDPLMICYRIYSHAKAVPCHPMRACSPPSSDRSVLLKVQIW